MDSAMPSLSRREFLRVAGHGGLGAVALSLGGASLLERSSAAQSARAAAREIRLEAREVTWELAPGKVIKGLAYNGQIPGPELRLKEGERVRIVVTNALAEPTTIHWHGVDVPNSMDGVPGITQKPIQPGATFVYEFDARPAGTRWYHTHFQEHRQMDLGLAAPLIIEPARSEPFSVDREITLVLDDWATGTGRALPPTAEGIAGGRGSMGGMMGMMGGGMMGGGGMGGMMRGRHTPAYDTMTINGKAYPATTPLRVRRGERLRLRFINASADHTHVIRLAGHRLHVGHTDGNPLVHPVEVDAVPIAPGERYDVLVVADHPGAWFLFCAQPGHTAAGEQMLVVYDGQASTRSDPPMADLSGLELWQYGLGRGRPVLPVPTGATRVFELGLGGGMMGSDVWTINDLRYPDTEPLRVRRGDRVRVAFSNMSMEGHPMHLHGQSFTVVAVNGARYAEPLVKDVVDVAPHMGSAVIEFTAQSPGDWFFHCHKPMHMDGGMITLVKIA